MRSRTQRQTRTQVSYHEPKRSTYVAGNEAGSDVMSSYICIGHRKLRQGDPHTIPLPTGWCRSLPLPHFQKSKTKKVSTLCFYHLILCWSWNSPLFPRNVNHLGNQPTECDPNPRVVAKLYSVIFILLFGLVLYCVYILYYCTPPSQIAW